VPTSILPGAEPYSAAGGPNGVLVLHGYTGSPQSMRPLAEAFAAAGFAVELPRLPGHGTTVEDLLGTRWPDWSQAAEAAYVDLAGRCEKVVVAGLSMGGALAVWLGERHPEIAGLVAVNPLVEPPAQSFRDILQGALDGGSPTMPAIGSDIALEGQSELAYEETPIAPLLSLLEATESIAAGLATLVPPVLLLSSRNDHVAPSSSGDLLEANAGSPVERVWLEKSFHVATLDYDAAEIEQRAVAFAKKVTAPA
jgi:carboxylesterase